MSNEVSDEVKKSDKKSDIKSNRDKKTEEEIMKELSEYAKSMKKHNKNLQWHTNVHIYGLSLAIGDAHFLIDKINRFYAIFKLLISLQNNPYEISNSYVYIF